MPSVVADPYWVSIILFLIFVRMGLWIEGHVVFDLVGWKKCHVRINRIWKELKMLNKRIVTQGQRIVHGQYFLVFTIWFCNVTVLFILVFPRWCCCWSWQGRWYWCCSELLTLLFSVLLLLLSHWKFFSVCFLSPLMLFKRLFVQKFYWRIMLLMCCCFVFVSLL